MLELLQMWALVEVLGFICLPLTITVFQNLPDRGWPFTKAIGMALLAFCVWLPLMCFQMLPFSQFFILGVLLLIVAFNIIGFLRVRKTLLKVIRTNIVYIVICEAIFLGMMFLLGWIRSYVPDIRSFEMFMDEGFLAAIMRSPHMPPNDMWYSGYPINYYYYAHFTMGVLAKLLGQSPSIAFNTGICTFYGLTAVNLFGVTCNIVTSARHTRQSRTATTGTTPSPSRLNLSMLRAIPYGLMTILMALILGNLAATQEWWDDDLNWSSFDWFWKPTRVVGSGKTINEFPAFSFLLSCFHAHVLALAFTILAIGLALNLFLEPDGKGLFVFGRGWRLPFTIGMTALVLGGLFTMNGWDFPTYLGLAIVCIALQQWLAYGMRFHIELALDIFTACAGLAALSFLLYAPFYLSFISPSQGIGLVGSGDRSPLSSEILIYGMFAFIFISLLLATVFRLPFFTGATAPKDTDGDDELVVVTLSATDEQSSFTKPDTENRTVAAQPLVANKTRNSSVESQPPVSPKPRSAKSTPWIAAIIFIIVAAVITFFVLPNSITFVLAGTIAAFGVLATLYNLRNRAHAFTLLLGTIAFALVALCEIVFLKDVFADNFPRMNTVFKFYFQAWALLSLTCGTGLYFILESFRPLADALPVQRRMQRSVEGLWAIGLLGLMLASAVYPLVGTYARTNHYAQRSNSLDGIDYLQTCKPPDCDYDTSGDYAAIHWINGHISGDPVIVEAVGDDYTSYGRISAFTGLPSPMGWVGHEYQWRVNWINNGLNAVDFNSRKGDVDTIYQDSHPNVVLSLLARYHVQYLYVGLLEQMKYPGTDLHRFAAFMNIVYSAKGVTIYQVR
jgi:YYY domain-containing protein